MGATDGGTGSEASYIAGAKGGAATVTLTAAQSGLPAHNHGTSITQPTFDTPSLSHSITQPAFSTPELTHSVTQPTVKYTAPKSHAHNLSANGWALITGSSYIAMRYKSLSTNWTGNFGVGSGMSSDSDGRTHADVTILGGATDSASAAGTSNGTSASVSGCAVAKHSAAACSRTTNVAISAHAAAACTRSTDVGVTVSNNTAAAATSAHTNMPPFQAVYIWYRSA